MTNPTAVERDRVAAIDRAMMARDIQDLREDITALRSDITDLVTAWKNANFALSLVKWIAALITAVSALWFIITHFGQAK